MACNCLNEIRKELTNKYPFNEAILKTSKLTNLINGKMIEKAGALEFNYKTKNKKGELSKKIFSCKIYFTHCPFCGKKYEEEN